MKKYFVYIINLFIFAPSNYDERGAHSCYEPFKKIKKMENTNEQNREMTAQESLSLITETLNSSRKEIIQRKSKYYILWGALLTVFSLMVYVLWKLTDKAAWNCLWFALPAIGFPLAHWLSRQDPAERVQNEVSRITQGI